VTTRPTVSCIISNHNYGRYLGAAIESVLAQSYPAELIEIIVVDDGSTDATAEVAGRYGGRIRFIQKPNGGLLSTINRGLAEASGELISFLSADDTWTPAKTERQVDFLSDNPRVGLVHSDMVVVDDSGAVVHPSFLQAYGVPVVAGPLLPTLLQRNVVSGGPMMVRASVVDRFAPIDPETAAWEDWWIAFHVAQVGDIDLIHEPLYRYRRHSSNMNLGSTGEKLQRIVAAELPFRRYMITSLPPDAVTPGELLAGYSAMVHLASQVAVGLGQPIESLLPVDSARRQASQARIAASESHQARGLPALAACDLVAALAHDPWDADAASRIQASGGRRA
jgi:glycosyltransferase involved in cell wall biosynthesis